MNRLKIALATAATLALGYAAAFGGSGMGPTIAAASKSLSATTSFAGNSSNIKGISTVTKTGNGGGGGSFKGTATNTCKPTGNPSNGFTC